jgi:hypothetical protein
MPDTGTFKVGDKVYIDTESAPANLRGVVFEVVKVNKVNVQATRVGGGRGINYPAYLLCHYNGAIVETTPVFISFMPGTVVSFKGRTPSGITTDTPMVVVKQGADKTNVAILGDDSGRYWRIAPVGLEKRDLTWLAEQLLKSL